MGSSIVNPDLLKAVMDNLYDGLYIVDIDRKIVYWNQAAERLTGYAPEEVVGSKCADNILVHIDSTGTELCRDGCPLGATIRDGQPREDEVFLKHKSGHRVPVYIRITPLRDQSGKIIGGIELFSDNSTREKLRERATEMQKLAFLDPLTQLSNRRHLESQMHAWLSLLERNDIPFGVLFIDIDHLKKINDDYGHHTGDLALKTVAETLAHSIRPFDTVGRWGGEEFLGIFPSTSLPALTEIARRLCALVRHSRVQAGHGSIQITVSIGGTIARGCDTVTALVERADGMMYESKRSGRDRFTLEDHP